VPTSITTAALPNQIQQLLTQRQQHTDAISKIDKTLAGVTAALGGTAKPVVQPKAAVVATAKKAAVTKSKPASRGTFTVSAPDLVLALLKGKPATTKEITKHLVSQGRTTSSVSNALSVLTKAKKLKRTPLGKGLLGSTYSLA
jgi:hypothetical protein